MRQLVASELPGEVRVLDRLRIPLSDGGSLAARAWLPASAGPDHRVPVVLEYHPYRHVDASAVQDATSHGYFAAHGYASVRVDLRGSGDSDGILHGEYLPQEISDGLEVIAWLAAQPWSVGKVGIIGKSWGAFNGLQLAARRPDGLAAVVAVMGSDDRYDTDVHYYGGCLLAWDMLSWASTMLAHNARPPSRDGAGEGWRATWLDRIERTPPFIHQWVAHQRYDDFWRQGSVVETPDAITCPTYLVGGWQDGYRDSVLRMLATSSAPLRAIIGPWGHRYPHQGTPGPAIGFLQEAVRWWDRWLGGQANGIEGEPRLRAWIQGPVRPESSEPVRPGRWIGLSAWPASLEQVELRHWLLGDDALSETRPAVDGEPVRRISGGFLPASDPGAWCGWGGETDPPGDQRREDAQWLSYDGPPLAEETTILGDPVLRVRVSADEPIALLAVRLTHVWPDGAATLIARGVLNLNHTTGRDHPRSLAPGLPVDAEVRLGATSYTVPTGHRLRLTLAPDYWPWVWPSPRIVTLAVHPGPGNRLELPVLRGFDDPRVPAHFDDVVSAAPPPHRRLPSPPQRREWIRDTAGQTLRIRDDLGYLGGIELADGRWHSQTGWNGYELRAGDPLSARLTAERTTELGQGDLRIRIATSSTMSCTTHEFVLTDHLEAWEGTTRVASKDWERRIPRDHQ